MRYLAVIDGDAAGYGAGRLMSPASPLYNSVISCLPTAARVGSNGRVSAAVGVAPTLSTGQRARSSVMHVTGGRPGAARWIGCLLRHTNDCHAVAAQFGEPLTGC